MTNSGVPDCLPSGNPVERKIVLPGDTSFIEDITGDKYRYDYADKLFIAMDEQSDGLVYDLQKCLNDKRSKNSYLLVSEESVHISLLLYRMTNWLVFLS